MKIKGEFEAAKIKFPDGTYMTSAGIGEVNVSNVWSISGDNVDFSSGSVGIGTQNFSMGDTNELYKLAVNGKIHARDIHVDNNNWADYVFYDDYKLPTLDDVEKHIKENGHLIDIPSAEAVKKNGIDLGKMDAKLLQKIEELTLYTIEQEKEISELKSLNSKFLKLQARLERLESEN